jgi:hypothetical protein
VQEEVPFQKALTRAKTGDTIMVSPAPRGIENNTTFFTHMTGILSVIGSDVFLNDRFVCNNDAKETNGLGFLPFYDNILIYRRNKKDGKTMHEFYWIRPSVSTSSKNTVIVPKPAFCFEADELKIIPLSSGKGFIVIEEKTNKIWLFKEKRIMIMLFEKISAKDVVYEGPYVTYTDTPTSVVVGYQTQGVGGATVTRFVRGHGGNRVAVHDHLGTNPPSIWATDYDFFYQNEVHDEKVIMSANTGLPTYHGEQGEFFTTSTALIRIIGSTVEANGKLITDSFVKVHPQLITSHPDGILYIWNDEIRMLVIKDDDIKKKSK